MLEIFITTEFEAFHCWADAPVEVDYLRDIHRHMFKVKLWLKVNHNDRDIEFFMAKKQLIDTIRKNYEGKIVGSCEMICQNLSAIFEQTTKVEVSEDGENGALLTL